MSNDTSQADLGPSNDVVLSLLNEALAIEHLAHACYLQNSRVYAFKGYSKLAAHDADEAVDEMGHATLVMDRILFLGGTPNFAMLPPFPCPDSVLAALQFTYQIEVRARDHYVQLVRAAESVGDYGTGDVARKMIEASDHHILWADQAIRLIDELGLDNYLQAQM